MTQYFFHLPTSTRYHIETIQRMFPQEQIEKEFIPLLDVIIDFDRDTQYAIDLGTEIDEENKVARVKWDIKPIHPSKLDRLYQKYLHQLEQFMDSIAKSKKYDDRKSFALRAAYEGPYQEEGVLFATWMDSAYKEFFDLVEKMKKEEIPILSFKEVLEKLPQPPFSLPQQERHDPFRMF